MWSGSDESDDDNEDDTDVNQPSSIHFDLFDQRQSYRRPPSVSRPIRQGLNYQYYGQARHCDTNVEQDGAPSMEALTRDNVAALSQDNIQGSDIRLQSVPEVGPQLNAGNNGAPVDRRPPDSPWSRAGNPVTTPEDSSIMRPPVTEITANIENSHPQNRPWSSGGNPVMNPSRSPRSGIRHQITGNSSTVVKTTANSPSQEHQVPAIYANVGGRLRSYLGWPSNHIQAPQQLAEAGLFYTGEEDCVKCFDCGGCLRRWEQDDNPLFEHARLYPRCRFINTQEAQDKLQEMAQQAQGELQSIQNTGIELASGTSLFITASTEQPTQTMPSHQERRAEEAIIAQVKEMGFDEKIIRSVVDEIGKKGVCVTAPDVVRKILTTQDDTSRKLQSVEFDEDLCSWCEKNQVGVAVIDCGCRICRRCAPVNEGICKSCGKPILKLRGFDLRAQKFLDNKKNLQGLQKKHHEQLDISLVRICLNKQFFLCIEKS